MFDFDVSFDSMKIRKAQLFNEFIVEMTLSAPKLVDTSIVFIDWPSNRRGSVASFTLENKTSLVIEESICLEVPITNN